jgi:hypothetical protein
MNGLRRPLGRVALASPAHLPWPRVVVVDVAAAVGHHSGPLARRRRHLSSSSSAPAADDAHDRHAHPNVNPPPSTRPPRLAVPSRAEASSTLMHYVGVGKAYINFYKSGLRAVLTNQRLARARLADLPVGEPRPGLLSPRHPRAPPPRSFSRADWILLWRVRRDLARIPLFGLVLLVTGEFTPLLVPWLDPIIPGTCRIPGQIQSALEAAERRRADAFDELDRRPVTDLAQPAARLHVLRSLHLTSRLWSALGVLVPIGALWHIGRGGARIAFLEGDDALLAASAEGVSALVPDEVRIACAERGIDVLSRKDGELRTLLGDWLRLTNAAEGAERRRRMAVLLMSRPEDWPLTREFTLPEWEL